ncbi:AAA family ATPase [Haemophilus sp. oral taxon 851]|uniref:AAA family ATPase n=1 Tax=Haemophilus sp. oral taxon 851 TaxID=762964 RepID=UPI0002462877|nr:AAA family ATPase [Haemophilus sp. oral taxon 851]EHO47801.1 ATPase family protein [Haemophilus sp. oral taxon 851 str. F0397]
MNKKSEQNRASQELDKVINAQEIAMQKRISNLLKQLNANMHEREQILAITLLGAISGQNTFLYGPPGTAKSLISRRLACAFETSNYFECLMNRFTTPEEIFGPISIKELKADRYVRQVEGYLPTSDFAFLDEIWKSSPAILNNLLTIINEHIFKNGNERIDVPLKSLISASNEVPAENQGLDALYDRFILRLLVPPIQENKNFNQLLNSKASSEKPSISPELVIRSKELMQWREQLHNVSLSDDTLLIIKYIRQELADKFEELKVYVSDRRWQRAALLLKASAFCNGRKETNHSDVVLLKYCLWTTPENREAVENIVMNVIKECGFDSGVDLADLDREKDKLDKEIHNELYYSEDIYDTYNLNGDEYFEIEANFNYKYSSYSNRNRQFILNIPFKHMKTSQEYHPVDSQGNLIKDVSYKFDQQGSCILMLNNDYENLRFSPKPLFKKGQRKQKVNKRLIKSLSEAIKEVRSILSNTLVIIEDKNKSYKKQLQSPFVTENEINVAVSGILKQIEQLKLRITDCERLESLCQ